MNKLNGVFKLDKIRRAELGIRSFIPQYEPLPFTPPKNKSLPKKSFAEMNRDMRKHW